MLRSLTPALTLCLVFTCALLSGCAGVKVNAIDNDDYLIQRRGDVLTTGKLSNATRTSLQIVGTDEKTCRKDLPLCRQQVTQNLGLDDEQRITAMAEIWLLQAMSYTLKTDNAALAEAYLQSARQAYAYLFHTKRSTADRALEDRQTQVRDYYNFSVQQALTHLFDHYRGNPPKAVDGDSRFSIELPYWQVSGTMQDVRLAGGAALPKEIIPAASLNFAGLNNLYRRDGLGAELVAVTSDRVISSKSAKKPWSETPFPAISAIIRFPGKNLAEVLSTNKAHINGYDPYRTSRFNVYGQKVPLAANFTSGYGLWLARSGFARQSLLTLIGRGEVLESPHLYLLQPYDPNRHIIIMLHGLASSPEAWINAANEILGDEALRQRYQIWQIYYPTNLPIALNQQAVRDTIEQTLAHFDPDGTAAASRDIVLLGHSMGGVISRLLVSSSGDELLEATLAQFNLNSSQERKARRALSPYLTFEPLPQVTRAIFAAAPHRGTPFAENRLSRWSAKLIKLPVNVLDRFSELAQVVVDPNSAAPVSLNRGLNSIDNLSARDPFIRASSTLPIAKDVHYHSIIGNHTPDTDLEHSNDGVVPYRSAHLEGADSELVVPSWHSVQNTPQAIVEMRRILHEHLDKMDQP